MAVELKDLAQQIRRIDFLHGLGVSIEAENVALACVSKRFLSVALRHFRRVEIPPISQLKERGLALAEAVASFVDEFGIEPGAVYLCLPRQEIMVNRIVLPAAAKENLAQVLEYEIERVIPLGREQVFFDYQVGEVGGGSGDRVAVLVLCVARNLLSAYIDALSEAGTLPKAVIASPVALGNCAFFVRQESKSPVAVVAATASDIEVTLLSQGRLVASHILGAQECRGGAGVEGLISRDLVADLGLAVEQIQVVFADAAAANGDAAGVDCLTSAVVRGLEGAAECASEGEDSSFVRAVGAALGAAREGGLDINLLPEEHRQSFREGLLPSIVLLAFSVVLLLAWGMSAVVRDGMTARQLRARAAELEPEVRRVEKAEAEGRKLAETLRTITADQDKHLVDLLKEMTELIPTTAYLTTFRYRNGRVEVDGFASSAADLIAVLENSPMFANVTFTSPVTKAQNSRERFSLVAEVER